MEGCNQDQRPGPRQRRRARPALTVITAYNCLFPIVTAPPAYQCTPTGSHSMERELRVIHTVARPILAPAPLLPTVTGAISPDGMIVDWGRNASSSVSEREGS